MAMVTQVYTYILCHWRKMVFCVLCNILFVDNISTTWVALRRIMQKFENITPVWYNSALLLYQYFFFYFDSYGAAPLCVVLIKRGKLSITRLFCCLSSRDFMAVRFCLAIISFIRWFGILLFLWRRRPTHRSLLLFFFWETAPIFSCVHSFVQSYQSQSI